MGREVQKIKEWMFSLQGKFILVASFCILVFTLSGSFVLISREKKLYQRDMINQCKVIAEISRVTLTNVMVFNELGMMDRQDLADYLDYFIMNLMERDKRIRYAMVFDTNGAVLASSNISEHSKLYSDNSLRKALLEPKETEIVSVLFGKESTYKITVPLNIDTKRWGVIQIGISMKEMHMSISSLKKEVALLVILFSSLSLSIISVGAKILAKPVTRLTLIMDRIRDHGDLDQHEKFKFKERRDELGSLQRSFLWMTRRLKDADKEHKKTIEVLSRTEKMVSIGTLASGVAHEINNPLGGITVCFKNLMRPGMDEETKQEHVEVINESLDRIKKIVEQLLNFSKMAVTEKSPVDLNGLITRQLLLLKYYISAKNIEVVKDLSEKLSAIPLDENKMGQVVMNIMINAIQAMENGGVMTIRTMRDNGFCEIHIEDTGKGIPSDIVNNIFDPFFTTKGVGEGTGLGLSVSKGIVEQHGGIIAVESAVNIGTKFRIRLPIA
jgi:signal transduction histidine kinase